MIIDFDELPNEAGLTADVCVIGSGAAGIALANELDGSPLEVIVLEGGGLHHEPASQDVYRSQVVGLKHQGIHHGRARIHGGTTTLWAGQALPFDDIDFERRDWVNQSGWPFSKSSLEPYYRRAERFMKVPTTTYDDRSWPPNARKPPAYDPSKLRAALSQYTRIPNLAQSYRAELRQSRNVRVVVHAGARELVANESASAVDRVDVRSLSGKTGVVRARQYIVCCGAIETARLLLASDSVEPAGLGNRHDLVGRYFQEHIHGRAAVMVPTSRKDLIAWFNPFYYQGIKRSPKICASEALQRSERIANILAETAYEVPEDSAVEAAKKILRAPRRRDTWGQLPTLIGRVARRPHEVAIAAIKYGLLNQTVSYNRGTVYLGIQSEQEPNEHSRVRLGDERDALGMRRAVLDWRLSALDKRSIEVFTRTVADEFLRLGIVEQDFDIARLPDDLAQLDEILFDSNHHMGTTRMHDDPRHGVVDRECRVHGLGNLFIGSAAVFPTGGSSNPTLTALALTLRIADRLKQELAAVATVSGAEARAMKTVTLSGTTLTTTILGFGCNSLLGPRSRSQALAILEAAYDAGIRHFDVARAYSSGDAEGVVGEFLRPRRDTVTITTKFGLQPPKAAAGRLRPLVGLARRLMRVSPGLRKALGHRAKQMTRSGAFGVDDARASLRTSLDALGIDRIDVYLLHEGAAADCTPELLGFLHETVAAGTIGRFGVGSSFPKVLGVALDRPEFAGVLQFEHSVTRRNLDRLRADAPPRGATITHGALGGSFTYLRGYLADRPDVARQWSTALDMDCGDSAVLSGLMLNRALLDNAGGIVLFSSTRPATIHQNVRSVQESKFSPQQLDLFAELAAPAGETVEIRPTK